MPSALQSHNIPNYFDPSNYYNLNLREGVITNRAGAKCCTLSAHLLRGLYIALHSEAGPAWRLVLRECGEMWGKKFAQRFIEEVGEFYGEGLEEMNMARFSALVEDYFATAGWGRLRLDFNHVGKGLILAEVTDSILGDTLSDCGEKMDVLFEGVLKSMFSEASSQPLDCYETQCIAQGGGVCRFIIGHNKRMKEVPDWIEQGSGHNEVFERLVATTI